MPDENDEREPGAAAIQNTQREEKAEKDEDMRGPLHPPSDPNEEVVHLPLAGDSVLDESPPNSSQSNTVTTAADLPLGNREAEASNVVELVREAPEQSVAASGGVHRAATDCEVVVDEAKAPPSARTRSPSQHAKAQEAPPSDALSTKPAKEKASPSSDAGTPTSSKLPGKNEGRRTKKKAAGTTGSPKATSGRNDGPDPKPAFLLKHHLFQQPRHKKATATDSPRGVKASSTPSEEAPPAAQASQERATSGPALDPSLKRKLIEGPESSLVVEGSVAQHVLNRIGKLRHEAVPSSALYGSKADRVGRTKELRSVPSSHSQAANRVTLREVIGPASSYEEPLFRVTAGPFRGLIGTAVDESSSGVDVVSDPRQLTVNFDETEALVRRNEPADCSGSPLQSVEEIFVEALREEARSFQRSLEDPAVTAAPLHDKSPLQSDVDSLPGVAQDYWFAYHLAKRYKAMKPPAVAASHSEH